jgi:hypothetical protein
MLNDPDRQLTVEVVARHLRFTNAPRVDIFNLCPSCGMDILVKEGGSPLGWAQQLINSLIDDGWAHEPPWIVTVLTALTFQYSELNPVLARVNVARANGPAPTDPLDDLWREVALHRGTVPVQGVSFQGRTTAFVNLGPQTEAIVAKIKANNLSLREEIVAGT